MAACSNCGKTKQVIIKQKAFCANCGEAFTAPGAQAASSEITKEKNNVLDLTKDHTKRHHSAQSIHGIRRAAQTKRSVKPPRTIKTTQPELRQARAQAVSKHPKISKFGKKAAKNRSTSKPATAMDPHYAYEVKELSLEPIAQSGPGQRLDKDFIKQLSETNPKPKRINSFWQLVGAKRRLASVAVIAAIALVMASYVTYLNVPGVSIRVAAASAGFEAQLPRYQPPGFGIVSPVTSSGGKIQIQLASTTDSQFMVISQEQTAWDPSTLLENYVLKRASRYDQLNQNGLTIYVYNGNHMAWINNGVLYTIEGSSALLQDTVAKIATSL